MIRYCKHCGTLLEEEATACPFCGVALEAPKEVKENKTRYCKHCGTYLTSDADTCFFCGADLKQQKTEQKPQSVPVESSGATTDEMSAAVVEPTSEATEEVSSKTITRLNWRTLRKKITKKHLFIIGGAMVAIIAVIFGLSLILSSPRDAVDLLIEFQQGDFTNLEDAAPPEYWAKMAEVEKQDTDAYIESKREYAEKLFSADYMGYYGSLYGDDYTIEQEIVYQENLSKEDLKNIKTALEKTFDIKPGRVSSAKLLIVKTVISGSLFTSKPSSSTLYAVKIDMTWYLISYSKSASGTSRVSFPLWTSAIYY